MLDSVLLGPEGEKWKKTMDELEHPQEYEDWLDAQYMPSHMKLHVSNWKDMIYPLEKTQDGPVLDAMWFHINIVGTNHPARSSSRVKIISHNRIIRHLPARISIHYGILEKSTNALLNGTLSKRAIGMCAPSRMVMVATVTIQCHL